jgi:hypothetical protein
MFDDLPADVQERARATFLRWRKDPTGAHDEYERLLG